MDCLVQEPACQIGSTALGDLLKIIRLCLLVVKLPRQLGTGFIGLGLERPRDDFFLDTSLRPQHDREQSSSAGPATSDLQIPDTVEPLGLPTFSLTPAEPEKDPSLEQIPLLPEPGSEGPWRCLASEFRNMLEDVANEDNLVGYWSTDRQHRQLPIASTQKMQLEEVDAKGHHTDALQVVSIVPTVAIQHNTDMLIESP